MHRAFCFACLASLFMACRGADPGPFLTADGSDKVRELVLEGEPSQMKRRVDAVLDDKIVLLGYDLDREVAAPGEKIEVTWFWKCLEPPGPGWRLFTHVMDSQGTSQFSADMEGLIRKHLQPEHWHSGMVVKDTQRVAIPKDWASMKLELRTGLWRGSERMDVEEDKADGDRRVRGPVIITGNGNRTSAKVPYAVTRPVIDGRFEDEAAWREAVRLGRFRDTMTGSSAPRRTEVRLMWDSESLFVAFRAEDTDLKTRYRSQDDELWHDDAFEIFLDPGDDRVGYYEIQVSPAGVIFDSHLATYRKHKNKYEWSSGVQVKVDLKGSLNDEDDSDRSWSAELAIPLANLTDGKTPAPSVGQKLGANFFRVDATAGKSLFSAWSPPLRGDFHALDRFGALVLAAPKPEKAAANSGPLVDAPPPLPAVMEKR